MYKHTDGFTISSNYKCNITRNDFTQFTFDRSFWSDNYTKAFI